MFAPLFGFISDKYCRKKMLLLVLGCSTFSVPLLDAGWIWPAVLINGVFGNVAPIARAAYCDVQLIRNKETNVINTFFIQPLPFILLSFSPPLFNEYAVLLIHIIEVVALLACLFFFTDQRDKHHGEAIDRFYRHFTRIFFNRMSLRFLLSFYILNSSWWFSTYLVDIYSNEDNVLYYFLATGLVFLIGTIICRIYSFLPERALPLLTLAVAMFFLSDWLFSSILGGLNVESSFMHNTMIRGIILPLWYVYFGLQAKLHEQGGVFGFMDSIWSLTELTGPLILMVITIHNIYYLMVPAAIVSALLVLSIKPHTTSSKA